MPEIRPAGNQQVIHVDIDKFDYCMYVYFQLLLVSIKHYYFVVMLNSYDILVSFPKSTDMCF